MTSAAAAATTVPSACAVIRLRGGVDVYAQCGGRGHVMVEVVVVVDDVHAGEHAPSSVCHHPAALQL